MITRTSLQHPNFRCRLHGAMIKAANYSRLNGHIGLASVKSIGIDHVRKALPCITGWDKLGYRFTDLNDGSDVTAIVLDVLREPMPSNKATFTLGHAVDKLWQDRSPKPVDAPAKNWNNCINWQ